MNPEPFAILPLVNRVGALFQYAMLFNVFLIGAVVLLGWKLVKSSERIRQLEAEMARTHPARPGRDTGDAPARDGGSRTAAPGQPPAVSNVTDHT